MQQFLELARRNPEKVTFSSTGPPGQVTLALLNLSAGTQMVLVPYKGAGPALAAVLSGEVHSSSGSITATLPHINSGKVRALGMFGTHRSSLLPDLPTLIEQGLPDVDMTLWYGILVPAKTPAPLVRQLNEEITAILARPESGERLRTIGSENPRGTPEDFQKLIHRETARWGEVIRKANIKSE